MSEIKLGQFIEGEANRDAIHIAIAPVIAGQPLQPGDHVGFLPDGRVATGVNNLIGVVDPYLEFGPYTGDRFWVLLYQNTVTNIRHDWKHPSFSESGPVLLPSNKWLEDYATSHKLTYEQLMAGVKEFLDKGGINPTLDDDFKVFEVPNEFWVHYKNVTGRDGKGNFWGCCI